MKTIYNSKEEALKDKTLGYEDYFTILLNPDKGIGGGWLRSSKKECIENHKMLYDEFKLAKQFIWGDRFNEEDCKYMHNEYLMLVDRNNEKRREDYLKKMEKYPPRSELD
jgi:hypothetical protein